LCSPAERLLWARLSVFAGSFTLDAPEGVCTAGEITASEVVDLLDRLVAQSLVEHAGDGSGVPRYRLLASIRHHGQDRIDEHAEPSAATSTQRQRQGSSHDEQQLDRRYTFEGHENHPEDAT